MLLSDWLDVRIRKVPTGFSLSILKKVIYIVKSVCLSLSIYISIYRVCICVFMCVQCYRYIMEIIDLNWLIKHGDVQFFML